MKVGILGSGDAAQALARGFLARGHEVRLGSREPKKLEAWVRAAGPKASAGTFADAAAFGDVVVLAVVGEAAEHALDLAVPANFRGKVLVDVTNPLDFSNGMPPGLLPGFGPTESLAERVQRKVPDAKVVKAFNTVPNSQMVDPAYADAAMLIAGDDADAKKQVEDLLRALGWKGVLDVGGLDGARWLEALVPLWVRAGAALGTWDHVFVVRKP